MKGVGLFAYGTLAIPEVLEALLGRQVPGIACELRGFRCRMVAGEAFPALAPDARGTTRGVFYPRVGPGELVLLDRYEGPRFERRVVTVEKTGVHERAFVYLADPVLSARLDDRAWCPDRFRARYAEEWIEWCRAFRARFAWLAVGARRPPG